MIAVIVTEYVWTAPGFWRRPPEVVRPRVGHVDPACSRIKADAIVARNVPMSSRAAGLPCSYCVPVVDGPFGPPSERRGSPAPSRPSRPGGGPPAGDPATASRNPFPGICGRCRTRVPKEAGWLLHGDQAGLLIVCEDCRD